MHDTLHACLSNAPFEYTVERCLHEVDPHAVYEVRVDGERAICKVTVEERGNAALEGHVLRYVDETTTVPVPSVKWVGERGFVTRYRPDAPDDPIEPAILERGWLDAAGRTLATLHREATFDCPGLCTVAGDSDDSSSGFAVNTTPNADQPWTETLESLLSVYETSLAGSQYTAVLEQAREFCRRHGDRLEAGVTAWSLLHGWFTPEHVAVNDQAPTCVIDFEHTLVGAPEWDYWRAAIPLFVGGQWSGPDDAEAIFRQAYESVRPLPSQFDDRRLAYRGLVAVSHLDSLATQRGLSSETTAVADAIADQARTAFEEVDARW